MKECLQCHSCYEDDQQLCTLDHSTLSLAFSGSRILENKYELLRCLGKGGMGAVYLARHIAIERKFAVKLIHAGRAGQQEHLLRFEREARALGQLKHPGIVEITDYGIDTRDNGMPYLVMEYIDGVTLEHQIRGGHSIPVDESLTILDSIAKALDFAHSKGILHRDLKPANILLCSDRKEQIKIVDFGLVRSFQEELKTVEASMGEQETKTLGSTGIILSPNITSPGKVAGTPQYMAPELFEEGKATVASDIFAFGVLAFQLITGKRPFHGSPAELYVQMMRGAPKPSSINQAVASQLDAPLLACLDPDPQERPRSAGEAVRKLRQCYESSVVRSQLPRILIFSTLISVLMLMLFSYVRDLSLMRVAEDKLIDWRMAMLPVASPDSRILILSIDEETLAKDSTPLAGRADEIGSLLEQLIRAGARGIAVDLVIPDHWNRSENFVNTILRHPDRFLFAALSSESKILGTGFTDGPIAVILGEAETKKLFGLVNVNLDSDSAVRKFDLTFPEDNGEAFPSFALRAAQFLNPNIATDKKKQWINYSIKPDQIKRISWKDADTEAILNPERFSDKLVLIGAEFAASGDQYKRTENAGSKGTNEISGLMLQAVMISSLLSSQEIRSTTFTHLILIFFMVFSCAFLANFQGKLLWGGVITIFLYIIFALVIFRISLIAIPIIPAIAIALVGSVLAYLFRFLPVRSKAKNR